MAEDDSLAYMLAGVNRRRDPFAAKRALFTSLAQSGMDTSPVQSPWQGVSRLAQALVGGYGIYKADADEKKAGEEYNSKLAVAMAEPDPEKRIAMLSTVNPELGARFSGQLAVEQAKIGQQQRGLQTAAAALPVGYGMPSGPPSGQQQAGGGAQDYIGAVGMTESGNKMIPNALGSGAFGPYQFMPGTWSDVAKANPQLGLPPTAQQANPEQHRAAAEALTKANAAALQAAGIQPTAANLYLAHAVGAKGAQTVLGASPDTPLPSILPPEWMAQNPQLRTTAGAYLADIGRRFGGVASPAGGGGAPAPGPQMAQAAPQGIPQGNSPQVAPGMPPPPSPEGIAGPALVAPPAVPDVPRPQPSPQLLQKHQQLLQTGAYGVGPDALARARAAVETEVDREWNVSRERSKLQYGQQAHDYNEDRKRAAERADPKFTEDANKAHAYALRVSKALPLLEQMVSSPEGAPGRIDRMVTNLPLLGNTLAGPRGEQFDQITRDLINAILRRESGATITDQEFKNAYLQYIPQPGDAPETAQLKLENIRTQLKAFADTANRTPDVYGMSGQRGATTAPSPVPAPRNSAPAAGAVEDGWRFRGGNPADRNNWERAQ